MRKEAMTTAQIKNVRESLNLTQVEFADRLGVSQATVSLWETGARRPTGSALKMIEVVAQEKTAAKKK